MSTAELLCQIKRLKQLQPPQWARIELISPYVGGITKEQLDMRRKAEILKYNNKSSTSVKKLTKREKFALLSRTNYKQSKKMNLYSTTSCSEDSLLLVPTSSSDVPGPIIYLYEDPAVPLYEFGRQDRNYSQYVEPIVSEWTIYREDALEYISDSSAIFFNQVLQNSINQPSYIYQFQIPIALQVTGTLEGNVGTTLNLSITRVDLYVVYDKTVVYSAYTQPNLYIQYRPLNSGEGDDFAVNGFVGNISFSNIRLVTFAGYLYKYVLKFTLSGSNEFSKKIIAGTELTDIDNINANIINSSGFTSTNSGFIFTGV